MEFTTIAEGGALALEGQPGEPFLASAGDVGRLIEACWSAGVPAALLYPENLPPAFFDLSSGLAGGILQTLDNYRIRLAVVCPPGGVRLSSRFAELLSEARRGRDFGLFESREAALAWLSA